MANISNWDHAIISPRGGFGKYLRTKFKGVILKTEDILKMCADLLQILATAGMISEVVEAKSRNEVLGYQLQASAIRWKVGDGTNAYHDWIRQPRMHQKRDRGQILTLWNSIVHWVMTCMEWKLMNI